MFSYTSFEGKQCALPMLTDAYGLYYNTDLLAKNGISAPPKTTAELADMAKKLTEYNPDGSIKVAGFVPLFGFYGSLTVDTLSHAYGAKWYDDDLKPTLTSDPNWAKMFTWQKAMVDAIGYDKLQKFAAKLGGANSEFSAQNGFETGKIAMMMDGEWRNAFIEGDKSKVKYATAPFPVDPDQAGLYGSGQIGGTIGGVPKGVKHAAESWLLLQFMTTDNGYLTTLAHGLKNVPSTFESLKDQELQDDPHFKTFLDIFANQTSTFKPITPIGQTDTDLLGTFGQKWQAGKVPDLQAGLKQLDDADQQAAPAGLGARRWPRSRSGRRRPRPGPRGRAPPEAATLGPAPPAGRARLHVAMDHRVLRLLRVPDGLEPVLLLHQVRHPEPAGVGRPGQLPVHVHQRPAVLGGDPQHPVDHRRHGAAPGAVRDR